MASIRKTKTASGKTAVQIVRYENRKVVIMKHIGSGHTPEEVAALVVSGRIWMEQATAQPALFPQQAQRTLALATSRYVGVTYGFAYAVLCQIAQRCGLDIKRDALLLDFAIMRLIEPTSKQRSIILLKRYFGLTYAERSVYRILPLFKERKEAIERMAIACAKNVLHSDLGLVLYDVLTSAN